MTYEIEDEVDWSDGTIDDPPLVFAGASEDSGYVSPAVHKDDGLDYLFESQQEDEYKVPLDTKLPPLAAQPTVTRIQRARSGVHLNRRQLSEQDYTHFTLYQANQKAYEATFLKHFVKHALHPSQIDKCYAGLNTYSAVQKYIATVSANVSAVADKMIRNAHSRAVNLLASAGKDSAPFWDVDSFERDIFVELEPNNPALVAHKLNESWHCATPQPSMVRYPTNDYPSGTHSSPLEEIDEVANTLFDSGTFDDLPAGRALLDPTAETRNVPALSDVSAGDVSVPASSGKWLASSIPPTAHEVTQEPFHHEDVPISTNLGANTTAEPRILNDLRQLPEADRVGILPQTGSAVALEPTEEAHPVGLTRLEQLVDQFGAEALSGHHYINDLARSEGHATRVPPWPTRLFNDHRRRLTQRSPQVCRQTLFSTTLSSTRMAVNMAISQGYQPVDPDFEVADVECREQSGAAFDQMFKGAFNPGDILLDSPRPAKEPQNGTKRRRDQPPPIRMFNKPVEPRKKRRKGEVNVANIICAKTGIEPSITPRKQKVLAAKPPKTATKSAQQKPSKVTPARYSSPAPLPPHPSGSTTLEPHQQLPPNASFTPQTEFEKPVWRCGIKHTLGHYYNAGDRKNCPGCFTALSDNVNAKVMDFYLPSRTYFHQLNPTSRWRPSKPFSRLGRARRSAHLSHNSIAKEAYWAAIASGSSDADALNIAVAAVKEHITPKPRKESTPPPSPSPEPDPGPHPSGSTTMEHDQDLPECASFTPLNAEGDQSQQEGKAWRCDVNHALGRYYMAGDKRSCPGCGSNREGKGKHAIMDFYLPPGVVVRQDVDVVLWKPRKPYRVREAKTRSADQAKTKATHKSSSTLSSSKSSSSAPEFMEASRPSLRESTRGPNTVQTHNQLASRKYWDAISNGVNHASALARAIQETETLIDGKEEDAEQKACKLSTHELNKASNKAEKGTAKPAHSKNSADTAVTSSLALNALRSRAAARSIGDIDSDDDGDSDSEEMSPDDTDEKHEYTNDHPLQDADINLEKQPAGSSSDEETSSESDSE